MAKGVNTTVDTHHQQVTDESHTNLHTFELDKYALTYGLQALYQRVANVLDKQRDVGRLQSLNVLPYDSKDGTQRILETIHEGSCVFL